MADPADYRPEAARVGLIVYFGVVTILFVLLGSAYVMRMGIGAALHGQPASGDWYPMPEPPLIWVNTGVLILSSGVWELTRIAARQGNRLLARRGFVWAGLLGLLFVGGQLLLWRDFAAAGYFLQSNPANSFFYLITALHGLHIAGGLYAWSRALLRGGELPIDLCAAYWHFLLLVWLVMLALLVST